MNEKRKKILYTDENKSGKPEVSEFPDDLILKIMEVQSLPRDVAVAFLNTQGKLRTRKNGKET